MAAVDRRVIATSNLFWTRSQDYSVGTKLRNHAPRRPITGDIPGEVRPIIFPYASPITRARPWVRLPRPRPSHRADGLATTTPRRLGTSLATLRRLRSGTRQLSIASSSSQAGRRRPSATHLSRSVPQSVGRRSSTSTRRLLHRTRLGLCGTEMSVLAVAIEDGQDLDRSPVTGDPVGVIVSNSAASPASTTSSRSPNTSRTVPSRT